VSFTDFIAAQPVGAPDVQIHADGIWGILFTSGSMALPKE
jgi:acyl-coenzyme A synthetase/AMP-(fatty) acid ligase